MSLRGQAVTLPCSDPCRHLLHNPACCSLPSPPGQCLLKPPLADHFSLLSGRVLQQRSALGNCELMRVSGVYFLLMSPPKITLVGVFGVPT